MSTAALFHKRKVEIVLTSLKLLNDREKDNLLDTSENGTPPAEVVVESQARFNPYVQTTFNKDLLVHDDRMATRTAPVLDEMDKLWVSFKVIESDWYPRFKVAEWALDESNDLVAWSGNVPLQDGYTFAASSKYAVATYAVRVHTMY